MTEGEGACGQEPLLIPAVFGTEAQRGVDKSPIDVYTIDSPTPAGVG
jgi:hypothetical protein